MQICQELQSGNHVRRRRAKESYKSGNTIWKLVELMKGYKLIEGRIVLVRNLALDRESTRRKRAHRHKHDHSETLVDLVVNSTCNSNFRWRRWWVRKVENDYDDQAFENLKSDTPDRSNGRNVPGIGIAGTSAKLH